MSEWWATTVSICLGITAVISLVSLLTGIFKDYKKPTDDLEKRVSDLERKILENYDKRITDIEKGNKVTQKAILELLKHSIDGNNVDGLKKAEKDLSDYLIDK